MPKKNKAELNNNKNEEEELEDIENLGNKHAKSFHTFHQNEIQTLQKELIVWFDKNKRDLPWRFDDKPQDVKQKIAWWKDQDGDDADLVGYGVWVSEIMLQQTRVQTVIDYYTKWMKKWPTVFDLAKASLEEVNEMWSGLGYYRRAKFLHEGAKLIVTKYNGKLPRTAKELQDIPGIGKYTAGAVASIAFSEVTPLVDGNVIRVLSRLRAIDADPKNKDALKLHWELAESIVDTERPGSFNQALMELGATVCTAQSPECSQCPVSTSCKAYQEVQEQLARNADKLGTSNDGEKVKPVIRSRPVSKSDTCTICGPYTPTESVTKYPQKAKKTNQREEMVAVSIIQDASDTPKYLIVQRPETGLLAGLWEFPQVAINQRDDEEEISGFTDEDRNKLMKYIKNNLGIDNLDVTTQFYVGSFTHIFSHIRQTLLVEFIQIKSFKETKKKGPVSPSIKWSTQDEIKEAAISKIVRKCFDLLEKHNNKPNKSKKRAAKEQAVKETDKKQKSISSFFVKKS